MGESCPWRGQTEGPQLHQLPREEDERVTLRRSWSSYRGLRFSSSLALLCLPMATPALCPHTAEPAGGKGSFTSCVLSQKSPLAAYWPEPHHIFMPKPTMAQKRMPMAVSVTFGPLLPCGAWCCFYKSPVLLQLLSTDSVPVYSCSPWANSEGGCDRGARWQKSYSCPIAPRMGRRRPAAGGLFTPLALQVARSFSIQIA